MRLFKALNNGAPQQMAAGNASVTTGQTYSYVLRYNLMGRFVLWRDGVQVLNWTDSSGLTSGGYLALRTDSSVVSFDDIEVSRFKKYYHAGGQRVAMREAETVSFLLSDHLGSTAVTANSSGVRTGELWYKPWGEYRGTAYGTTPTSYRFTGQREDATIGLYFYNSRYYDATLGRFIQADTIVPEPGNPQALNRYAYVLNNPLRYTDPTGHAECSAGDTACWQSEWQWKNRWYNAHGWFDNGNGWTTPGSPAFADEAILTETIGEAGISFVGSWDFQTQMTPIATGIVRFGQRLSQGLAQLASLLGGGATIEHGACFGHACALPPGTNTVRLPNSSDATWLMQTVVHELAHIIDWHSRIQTGVTSVYGNPVPTYGRFSDAWHGAPLTDYAACTFGGDGCINRWERWAAAVTVYVFGAETVKTSGPLRLSGAALAVQMSRMHDLLEGWR